MVSKIIIERAAKTNFGGAYVNILMMNNDLDEKAHGYDLSYDMNNFSLSASMNSDYDGDELGNGIDSLICNALVDAKNWIL